MCTPVYVGVSGVERSVQAMEGDLEPGEAGLVPAGNQESVSHKL